MEQPTYASGQIWKYKTRLGETDSRLTVRRVERIDRIGTVVFVRIDAILLKDPSSSDGTVRTIRELPFEPFTNTALDASVTIAAGTAAVPDSDEEYRQWLATFEPAHGVLWKQPVATVLDAYQELFDGMN